MTTAQPDPEGLRFGELVREVLLAETLGRQDREGLWTELYGRLKRRLEPWVDKQLQVRSWRSGTGAEDVFHETLIRFIKSIKRGKFRYEDEESTLNWFYKTAWHVIAEADKKKRPVAIAEIEALDMEQQANRYHRVEGLFEDLGFLDPEARCVITLRFIHGLSLREIARHTRWSLSKAKRVSASAIRALQADITK